MPRDNVHPVVDDPANYERDPERPKFSNPKGEKKHPYEGYKSALSKYASSRPRKIDEPGKAHLFAVKGEAPRIPTRRDSITRNRVYRYNEIADLRAEDLPKFVAYLIVDVLAELRLMHNEIRQLRKGTTITRREATKVLKAQVAESGPKKQTYRSAMEKPPGL